MRGEELNVVGQRQQLSSQALVELPGDVKAGVDPAGGLVEQIRSPQIADEDEVAGEHEPGLLRCGGVGQQEGEMFGGMPRSVHHPQHQLADGDGVTVSQAFALVAVLPVSSAFTGQMGSGAGGIGQFSGAGEEIGVNVRLGDVGDAHPLGFGQLQVGADVPTGVDDDGVAGGLTADEVARVR